MQPFSAWLDEFFAAYYRRRPVSGTFIGVHDHDHRLPNYSKAGTQATLTETTNLRRRLTDGTTAAPQTPTEAMDKRLADGFLSIQQWELGSHHFQRGNPTVYTGEAIFGVLSLFLRPFAPIEQRVEAAIARMEETERLLNHAWENIETAPTAWIEKAIRECEGAIRFLSEGINLLMQEQEITNPRLREAANGAEVAFWHFKEHLQHALLPHGTAAYACGEEAFERYLRDGHCLDQSGAEVERYARDAFAEACGALVAGVAQFGATDWRVALAQLADLHPTVEEYTGRYQQVWDACRETATAHDLLTWPDHPLRYEPQPLWARGCAPYLYFLFYRSPAPYDHVSPHRYLVTPIDTTMPPEEQTRRLRATNDSVIKLNHVVHHGSIGHHVQNWHAFRAASRIGQIAGVDCASRIALFSGGTLVEGWSSYVVDLMGETGFLTPLEMFSQRYARLRAAARAIVDVNLHNGRFSLDDAIAFYRDEANMSPDAAKGEAVKNSMNPGAAMMYLIGQDAIRDLRREVSARDGADFSLRRFHDEFLSYGSVPVSLIRAAMLTPDAPQEAG